MPYPSDDHTSTHSVGKRIAAIRKQRGLTQHGLAQRAHVSYSCLTKVESGHKAASPTVTAACARALRVAVTDLTGQPYFDSLRRDQLDDLVQPLRQAVVNPLLPPDHPSRPLGDIWRDITRLDESRLRGEYMEIGTAAPALIDELLRAADSAGSDRERERAFYGLALTYRLSRSFLHKLGFLDLGLLSLDRMEQAAARAGDPHFSAVACHYRSDYFLYHDAYDQALRGVEASERELEDLVRRGDIRALSVQGTLHLKAAVVHSRARLPGSADATRDRISAARDVARRLDGQPDQYGLIFDAHNVSLHAVSTRIDLGDPGRAAEDGERLRLPEGWALNRAGHHYMDMGRAYERIGRRDRALAALTAARSACPAQTRYHPTTRETVLALLRGRGTPSRELTSFARWVGV